MSKLKNNRSKVFIVLLIIVALIGACFGSVGLYVKNELSKPKFELPERAQSVTALPDSQSGIYNYISKLCEELSGADNIEQSLKTEVGELTDGIESSFSDSDNAVIRYIMNNAAGTLNELYRSYDNVKISQLENAPVLLWSASLVTDCSAVQGSYNDRNEYVDDDYYFIRLTFDPSENEYNGDILSEVTRLLSPDLIIESAQVETRELYADYKIDRFTDHLVNIDITREYTVSVCVLLSEQYKALLGASDSAALITLPYKTTEKLSFNYYGAYFTKPCIAVNKGDMETLPASVTVNSDAAKEDYELTFDVSDAEAIAVDEDGVMTVLKNSDESVTVTMTLSYEGHTYTDKLTVYITELEVETDV